MPGWGGSDGPVKFNNEPRSRRATARDADEEHGAMPGQDRIEIEQGGKTLRGSGSLRVFLGAPGIGGWSVVPTVEGVVAFDARVTSAEVEGITDAEVRVHLASGARHTFGQAVAMRHSAVGGPNTYALRLECHGAVS